MTGRIVRNRVEFEGVVTEELALVDGTDLASYADDAALTRSVRARPAWTARSG